MGTRAREKWRDYLNHYQYLLVYPLNSDYPYKELADRFGLQVTNIRHMVDWLQTKPEVIAYVRYMYSPESVPDWVGVINEDIDYYEFLKDKGVNVPRFEGAMDDTVDDDAVDEDSSTNEEVAQGTPHIQASTVQPNVV